MIYAYIIGLTIGLTVSQNVQFGHIGLQSDELKNIMLNQNMEFYFNKEIDLKKGKVIKYENEEKTKTLLYVFDKQNCCRYYVIIYDYIYLDEITIDLDNNHEKIDDNIWIENLNDQKFEIILKKEDWFFSIITKKVE